MKLATRLSLAGCVLAAFTLGNPAPAHAQGYIAPLIGYDFSGDSGCPQIDHCTDKKMNVGITLGGVHNIFGFEEEFAYAKNFFGQAPQVSSSVFTMMASPMIAPKIGPVRPYVLAGVGLIKTHVEFTAASIASSNNNNFGWNAGGGVMVSLGPFLGIRGDVRHFHSFQDQKILGFTLADEKLDFGRASASLVLKF